MEVLFLEDYHELDSAAGTAYKQKMFLHKFYGQSFSHIANFDHSHVVTPASTKQKYCRGHQSLAVVIAMTIDLLSFLCIMKNNTISH